MTIRYKLSNVRFRDANTLLEVTAQRGSVFCPTLTSPVLIGSALAKAIQSQFKDPVTVLSFDWVSENDVKGTFVKDGITHKELVSLLTKSDARKAEYEDAIFSLLSRKEANSTTLENEMVLSELSEVAQLSTRLPKTVKAKLEKLGLENDAIVRFT